MTPHDAYLFHEGSLFRLYEKLGAHADAVDGVRGTRFRVWAPSARAVSVIGEWNRWDPRETPLFPSLADPTVWERFVPSVGHGAHYKFHVTAPNGHRQDKADPMGFAMESPPATASIVWDLGYAWNDGAWMATRGQGANAPHAPMSIYEVHLGSWMRDPHGRMLTYGELAPRLAAHVRDLGFTHVELMPVMEHPFYGSWGYQVTGYYATTRRYGTPQDLMALIDHLHQQGIGVILDWVPGHFPNDAHGLATFDGTALYEHADPRRGFHPEWNSLIFDYGRPEVRSFLVSGAMFWLDRFHADGLRIDGVASMLHLDYARKAGEWLPNDEGGRENKDAIVFLRRLNDIVRRDFPDVITIAEDSTNHPMVTRTSDLGGLGFHMKWDMGWMHDTLDFLGYDPLFRGKAQDKVTFRSLYAYNESYVLPLSHDEVVHGKRPLLHKMWGDAWQQRANLRLLYGLQWLSPGKKLLFMGCEFADTREWDHDRALDWHLLGHEAHRTVMNWVRALNRLYREARSLHVCDSDPRGFQWVSGSDTAASVIAFLRHGVEHDKPVLVVASFTPLVREDYWVGVPCGGRWREVLSSDALAYGGTHVTNGEVVAEPIPQDNKPFRLRLRLGPLAISVFEPA
jgi:1,4-alpha-glucan branching enzyme